MGGVEKLPGLVNSGSRIRFAKREARDHVWRSLSNGWPSQRDYDLMQKNGCSDDFVSIFRDDRLRSGGLAATLDGAGRELMRRSSGSCLPALGGLFDSPSFALFDTRRKNSAGAPFTGDDLPSHITALAHPSSKDPAFAPADKPSVCVRRRRSRLAVGIPAPQTGTRT